jgi:hypothetical protein
MPFPSYRLPDVLQPRIEPDVVQRQFPHPLSPLGSQLNLGTGLAALNMQRLGVPPQGEQLDLAPFRRLPLEALLLRAFMPSAYDNLRKKLVKVQTVIRKAARR